MMQVANSLLTARRALAWPTPSCAAGAKRPSAPAWVGRLLLIRLPHFSCLLIYHGVFAVEEGLAGSAVTDDSS